MIARAQLKPGWLMTQDQHDLFWRLWRNACAWQGWDKLPPKERDAKRRETLAECGFSSATLIDHKDGFDSVKKRLLELAGRVVNEREDGGDRRRIMARIREAWDALLAAGYSERAINTILRERFHVVGGLSTIADLDTPELLNVSRTLMARMASIKRRPAGTIAHVATPLAMPVATPISKTPQPTQIALFGG